MDSKQLGVRAGLGRDEVPQLARSVAVGAGDSQIFLYAGTENAARDAERVARDALASQGIQGTSRPRPGLRPRNRLPAFIAVSNFRFHDAKVACKAVACVTAWNDSGELTLVPTTITSCPSAASA